MHEVVKARIFYTLECFAATSIQSLRQYIYSNIRKQKVKKEVNASVANKDT